MKTRLVALVGAGLLVASQAQAQLVIADPAVTVKMTAMDEFLNLISGVATQMDGGMKRIMRPYSFFVSLDRWTTDPQPLWRTRRVDPALPVTVAVMDAFNGGDKPGAAIGQLLTPRLNPDTESDLSPSSVRSMATLDMFDSGLATGIDATGVVRGDRKVELAAKAASVEDLLAGGSMAKILDKMSGLSAIQTQQRSAGLRMKIATTDQLMIRRKMQRDSDADAIEFGAANLTMEPTQLGNVSAMWNAMRNR